MTTRYPSPYLSIRLTPGRRMKRRLRLAAGAPCFLLGAAACAAFGAASGRLMPNVALPTAGGTQLWTDVAYDAGWKVQRHAWTGHARLLDPEGVRRAWGAEDACCRRLEQERPLVDGTRAPLVILLHGLARSHRSLGALEARLSAEGYEVLAFEYASTRADIEGHAAHLATLLERHMPAREVHFVTHSLGGLVLRALLADASAPWREVHRLGRAVTLAAPHGGAHIAAEALEWDLPGWLLGPALHQLGDGRAAALPAPSLPFATVAGVRGSRGGWNPWVPGDDDGLVAESEAHLVGEAAALQHRVVHSFIMSDPEVLDWVVAFLTDGAAPPSAAGAPLATPAASRPAHPAPARTRSL